MSKSAAQPPVVLLHGWGGSFERTYARVEWSEGFERSGRRVVGVDLPGHGDPSASTNPEQYSDLANAVYHDLPGGKVDAVGFSLGAKVLLKLASTHPDKFHRIVLGGIGDNLFAPEKGGQQVADLLESGERNAPEGLLQLVDYALASGGRPEAMAAVLRRKPNPVFTEDELKSIDTPILIVNGSEDSLAGSTTQLRGCLVTAGFETIEGVNHINLTDNRTFKEMALAFLYQS